MHKASLMTYRLGLIAAGLVAFLAGGCNQRTASVPVQDVAEDRIAGEICDKLVAAVRARGGEKTPPSLDAYRVVFLYNSAPVSKKTPYPGFVAKVIHYVSRRMLKYSHGGRIRNPHLLSVYPYQLHAYLDGPSYGSGKSYSFEDQELRANLAKSPPTIALEPSHIDTVPGADGNKAILDYSGSDPSKWSGHDDIGSRDEVIRHFAERQRDGRPLLIVQFTLNDIGYNRHDQARNSIISRLHGDEMPVIPGVFEDTGFEKYDGFTREAQPEAPDGHRVLTYIWLFGPKQLGEGGVVANRPLIDPQAPSKPIGLIVGLVAAAAAAALVAALWWWFAGKVTVTIEGTPRLLRRGMVLGIVAPTGRKESGLVYELAPHQAAGAPAGTLASISYGLEVVANGKACSVSTAGVGAKTSLVLPRGKEYVIGLSTGQYTANLKVKVS